MPINSRCNRLEKRDQGDLDRPKVLIEQADLLWSPLVAFLLKEANQGLLHQEREDIHHKDQHDDTPHAIQQGSQHAIQPGCLIHVICFKRHQ